MYWKKFKCALHEAASKLDLARVDSAHGALCSCHHVIYHMFQLIKVLYKCARPTFMVLVHETKHSFIHMRAHWVCIYVLCIVYACVHLWLAYHIIIMQTGWGVFASEWSMQNCHSISVCMCVCRECIYSTYVCDSVVWELHVGYCRSSILRYTRNTMYALACTCSSWYFLWWPSCTLSRQG